MTLSSQISFDEARSIAQEQALFNLSGFTEVRGLGVLEMNYLQAGYCWMFFRNRKICIPETALLGIEWVYVVSKRGKFSMAQDFSSDRERLLEYLQTMSDYFACTES